MKKRLAVLLCALCAAVCSILQAAAAETIYPVSVESYTDSAGTPYIKKVYHLSLTDSPAGIPTEDFEQNGYIYHLMDMTQAHDIGVDAQSHSETITQDSDTCEVSEVLKQLDGQREVTTEDGYTGTLLLDHTSVTIQPKGYKTSTRNLSANRTYPDLSDADLSLVPKTITDGGRTLTLSNVQWSTDYQEDGSAHYTASATYAGTSTSRHVTGYTVSATYTGEVTKMNCEIVTYTAIFTGQKSETEEEQDMKGTEPAASEETAVEEEPVTQGEPAAQEEPVEPDAPVVRYELEDAEREPQDMGLQWFAALAACVGIGAGLVLAGIWIGQILKKIKENNDKS